MLLPWVLSPRDERPGFLRVRWRVLHASTGPAIHWGLATCSIWRVVSQTDLCWTTMNGGKLNGGQLLWGGAPVCVYFLTIRASPPLLLL
jgi:hypothetical protein